ncbi:hypothetical protein GCM10011390_47250 [Aureimonas endophytica]|uniref:SH3b domain-containing protein n=1 Tax=Aureimonas endophytica TaxID=2027858 RepID=A0A917A1Q2_9HYPH|nr:SH3 domain-containing protein [Aureimonas endophytica]GGE22429.1 hypothetical protein GCM10011390_47250 [Aureimonas endophytica]
MKPHGPGRKAPAIATRSRLRTAGTALLKASGWIIAVPLVCVAVIAAGAVPLYLLLPDAPAPAQAASATLATEDEKPAVAPAAPIHEAALASKPAPLAAPLTPAVARPLPSPPKETNEAGPPDEAVEDMAEDAPAAAEPAHLGIVPTPRPEIATAPETAPGTVPADEPARDVAALTGAGARDRVGRAVTLRAGPHGRQIGVLPQGTEVEVLRCDGWCEVRSAEGDGWIHSSFLAGGSRMADRAPERMVERPRRDGAESRRMAREEARRARQDWRRGDPDWMLPDDDPMAYADDPRGSYDDAPEPYPYRYR